MRTQKVVFPAAIVAGLMGCTSPIPSYSPEPQVTSTLKGAHSKVKVIAEAPGFPDDGSIICRAFGPVTLPEGQTFTQYISNALRLELATAGAYDPLASAELRVKLLRVDFQTTLGATNWYIDGEYVVGGTSFQVSTIYNDKSSFLGAKACGLMASYFRPAMAHHIQEVFQHPAVRKQLALVPDGNPAEPSRADATTRLRQFESLYKDGVISKEEYDARRKQILDGL